MLKQQTTNRTLAMKYRRVQCCVAFHILLLGEAKSRSGHHFIAHIDEATLGSDVKHCHLPAVDFTQDVYATLLHCLQHGVVGTSLDCGKKVLSLLCRETFVAPFETPASAMKTHLQSAPTWALQLQAGLHLTLASAAGCLQGLQGQEAQEVFQAGCGQCDEKPLP